MIRDAEQLNSKKKALLRLLMAEEGLSSSRDNRIRPRDKDSLIPLSFAMERLWFLYQLEPDSGIYNISTAVRLRGDLDQDILRRSFQEIMKRHETLRTTCGLRDGQPFQSIASDWILPLAADDLSTWEEHEREEKLSQLIHEEGQRPFDMTIGPLVRMKVVHVGPQDHVLMVTMHHMISDGWSMQVFVRECMTVYESFRKGRIPPLSPLPIQYADFAMWQRRWLSDSVMEEQLAFWKRHLDGVPFVLNLPTDRPRPAVQRFTGASYPFAISSEVLTRLQALRQQKGMSHFMLLLAAFEVLLARYAGQESFCVGTPVSNRTRLETEGVIGFFVNTLVMRADVSGNPSVTEMLRRVRENVLATQGHQDLPFEKLVEALHPERTLSHSPLFQVMFVLENEFEKMEVTLEGLHMSPITRSRDTTLFDLTLEIVEERHGVRGVFEYRTDVFEAATIARMATHFQRVLEWIAGPPEARLSELVLLTNHERQQVLEDWNATHQVWGPFTAVHGLFEAQASRTPDIVAVVCREQKWTYGELNDRANQVAHFLRKKGVRPEVRVGLCVERSLEMVAALLGILKTGGTYVPIDPSYPRLRQQWILTDAQIDLLVIQKQTMTLGGETDVQVLNLNTDWQAIALEPSANIEDPIHPEQAAYMIYTSGSTGTPKGVLITHGALGNHMHWYQQALPLTRADRVPHKYSLSFDVGTLEILAPLLAGARLCLMPSSSIFDSQALAQFLLEHEATVIDVVPSVLRVLLEEPAFVRCRTLRRIICGGEVLSVDLQAQVWTAFDESLELVNLYGPTETTMDSTIWTCQRGSERASLPIGQPIANTQMYVLDSHLMPVPVGVWGELHIGGEGLARGYHRNPELTAARFIPHPFSPDKGQRLYKTGDLVRYASDGNLEYQGRLDSQVKLRGFRIETGEIEAVLEGHPAVEACAVIASEEDISQKALVAVVEPKMGPPELWPSVGEYPVYDDMLYYAMTHDGLRNQAYRQAIEQRVSGKVVADLGTGADVWLARMCVEAGAKHVYAIEMLEEAFYQAQGLIKQAGLKNKITLLHGHSMDVQLPEQVDVCVSEVLGHIASSEGVISILNDARRFLKADGVMIPSQSDTNIAAVSLPDLLAAQPQFSELSWRYVQKVFDHVGHAFDIRVGIKNFPRTHLLSDVQLFEELVFNGPVDPLAETSFTLTMQKAGRVDGLLLWLAFSTVEGQVHDILTGRHHQYSWVPVFFPLFDPGIEVQEGDRIHAVGCRLLDEHPVHPNYRLTGRLVRQGGPSIAFTYDSIYQRPWFQNHPFYRKLFANGKSGAGSFLSPKDLRDELRKHLQQQLPDYMVPSAVIVADALPLTVNGKIDRQALRDMVTEEPRRAEYVPPRTSLEARLVSSFAEVLGVKQVSIHDDFFERGGHSLLAVKLAMSIQEQTGCVLPLSVFFQTRTPAGLAGFLHDDPALNHSVLIPLQPRGTRPPLYCIDPSGGLVLAYRPLAGALGLDQPVYGVETAGLWDLTARDVSLPDFAGECAKTIRKYQPEGPYYFLGWSAGATIALAIIHEMERQRQTVGFLGVVDTTMFGQKLLFEDVQSMTDARVVDECISFLTTEEKRSICRSSTLSERRQLEKELSCIAQDEQFEYVLRWAQAQGYIENFQVPMAVLKRSYLISRQTDECMRQYPATPVHTPVHVWWAAETLKLYGSLPIDWKRYTRGPVQNDTIQGDHGGIITNAEFHHQVRITLETIHDVSMAQSGGRATPA